MAEGFRLSHVVIVSLVALRGEEPLYQEQHGFEREPKDFEEAIEMDGRYFQLVDVKENGTTEQGQTRLVATYSETSSRPPGARVINGRLPPRRTSAAALRSGAPSRAFDARGTEDELARLRSNVERSDSAAKELAAKDDEIARLRQELASRSSSGGSAPQQ